MISAEHGQHEVRMTRVFNPERKHLITRTMDVKVDGHRPSVVVLWDPFKNSVTFMPERERECVCVGLSCALVIRTKNEGTRWSTARH